MRLSWLACSTKRVTDVAMCSGTVSLESKIAPHWRRSLVYKARRLSCAVVDPSSDDWIASTKVGMSENTLVSNTGIAVKV